MKRRPAYARHLEAVLASGHEPVHGIAIWLDSAPPSRPLFAALACFCDTDPTAIDWSLCTDRDVVIPQADQCDPNRLELLLIAIQCVRPRRLQAWSADGSIVRYIVTTTGSNKGC